MHKKLSLGTYLAHAGICSRRNADTLVRQGHVTLNGQIVREPGTPIRPGDKVLYKNKPVQIEKKVYILLNKPLDCLSAASDAEYGRKTVIDLVDKACNERLYPVGRLDYQTTGLILLTNDGDFAQRLAHPSYEVFKTYRVTLNVKLKQSDLVRLKKGVLLEDGPMVVDDIYFDQSHNDYKTVNVVIHSGKNRIVRRLFQHIGYRVVALDRINYAGLSKRGLPVGKWRFLTFAEIEQFKRNKI